jgi:hypothetical protein
MSFWAGVAKGFKDAKEAKAEQEELDARRAERQSTFEYTKGRDEKADERYETEQRENLRRWQATHDVAVQTQLDNKLWRESQAEREQSNIDRTFTTSQQWKNKEWALGVDKWKFTQDQAKEATAHSNKLFNMAIDKFEYSKDRDVVQDAMNYRAEARTVAEALRVKEAQTFNQEMADKNFKMREKQFKEQMRAAGVSENLAQKGFDLKKRAADLDYTKSVVGLIPASLASALSGDKGEVVPIGTQTTVAVSKKFTANYNTQLTKQEQESPFFKAAISSPSAQASLQAFVDAQAKKGNEVQLNELPQYFSYLGQVEGKNEEEALEIVQDMMKGDGLENPEAMAKGLMVLKGYRPTEELFQQTGTPPDANEVTKGADIWKTAVANEARMEVGKITDEDKKDKVERALAFINKDENDARGYQILAELNYGKSIMSEFNLEKNPLVISFYPEPVEKVMVDTPVEASADPNLPMSSNATDDAVFEVDSVAAFREAKDSGYTGPIKYKGVTYAPKAAEKSTVVLTNDAGEELDIEDALAAEFNEEAKLKELNGIEEVFDKQAEALSTMGKSVSDEQAEGNRPGEKEIDTDTFVDRSFKGEGDGAMDLSEASTEVVTDKIMDVVDAMPPRTPKSKRKEWAMKEFRKRYSNADISEEELEVKVDTFLEFANQ